MQIVYPMLFSHSVLSQFERCPPPRELQHGRLFLQKRQERFVTSAFHFFDWNAALEDNGATWDERHGL